MEINISCITPTFNRAYLLKRAIESTLAQTYSKWEMIIVDDGSTDNTKQIVMAYVKKDNRIRYFVNPAKGANSARNFGIKKAVGKYIAFLDDDAENLPHRFELQSNAAKKSNSKFIISGYKMIKKNGKEKIINNGLWVKGAGITSRWFIEKDILFKAGLFDETMPSMQENELSYRIAKYVIYANQLKVVTIEHNTLNSISEVNGLKGSLMLIEKHYKIMPPLEAAWWYFMIGIKYYQLNNLHQSLYYLKLAANHDKRKIYKIAYLFLTVFKKICTKGIIKLITSKILFFLSKYKYPKIVEHPVIE